MIAVLPTLHAIYKISFEFFVSSAGNSWENIIHLTKDNVQDGHSCNRRIRGLWTTKFGNQLQFYLSGCVNGAEKVIYPFADINTWNSIEGNMSMMLMKNIIIMFFSMTKKFKRKSIQNQLLSTMLWYFCQPPSLSTKPRTQWFEI